MDDRPAVQRRELDGRMQVGGRRPADQNRDAEPHLLDRHDHLGHFLERRGNQSAQSDHVGLLPNRRLDDPLALDHHAEIFHPIPVAGQHDRDDVLPDVVHVALDGSQHHAPGGRGAALAAFGFDVGRQYGDGPLHHPRALDHLRQEHLALAEQLAYAVHAAHQRALDHGERIAQFAVSFLGILVHIVGDTFQHRMGEPFGHRSRAPPQSFAVVGGRSLLILDLLGIGRQTLGRIRPAGQHDVLAKLQQRFRYLVVNLQHRRIDDAHVHSLGDRMIQENRMHRLAHGIVTPKRERQIADTSAHFRVRTVFLDPAAGADEIESVAVVLLDTGGHRQHVRVENDVLGRETGSGQQTVGTARHLDLALERIGLPPLVEQHHDGRRAVPAHERGTPQELGLALLEGDGVDDRLALHAAEPGLDHLPFRRIDHYRHAGDVGLGHQQVQKIAHRPDAVDQPVVHADVDNLSPAFDLLPGDRQSFLIASLANHAGELGRAGHIGPLADVDEIGLGRHAQRLQPAQRRHMRRSGDLSRSAAVRHAGDLGDMDGRRAAAPPDDIEQSLPQIAVDRLGHPLRRLVVAAEAVREPGIRMRRHGAFGHGGEPGHVRLHLLGPEAAIESDRQQARMRDGRIESLDRLPRKRASARIGNRPRNHDRDRNAALGAQPLDRKQGRLRVQRVEHGLDEQDVGPAVDEAPRLLVIGFGELVESHRPVARIVHVGRDGGRPVRRAHRAGDEAGLRCGPARRRPG